MLTNQAQYTIKEGLGGRVYSKLNWMRALIVVLTSKKLSSRMTFGEVPENEFSISVDGYKYMSALKDTCTIKINNLTYSDIIQIIDGEYYDVEIFCGYKSGRVFKIFEGGVLYVSNNLGDRKTTTATILCASKLVAQFGQKRINLSLNSGINMYTALKFVFRRAGIQNANISSDFKKRLLKQVTSVNGTPGGWIEAIAGANDNYFINTDETDGATVSMFTNLSALDHMIEINADNVGLSGGYPRLNTSGLTISLMPTFPFKCGDVIKLDNSLINMYVGSNEEASKNYGYLLDKEGCYMIYQISYRLQNRGTDFGVEFLCKSLSYIRNVSGVTTGG